MWNPFRKKPEPPPTVTSATPLRRAEAILSGMHATIPNGHAQILIALANTRINYEVYRDVMRKQGKEFTVDDYIRQNERLLAEHKAEIPQRRLMWFLTAAMIYSLGDGNGDPEVEDRLAQIYILLADSSEFMLNVLEHNILWTADEKVWFDKHNSNRSGVVLLWVPKGLKKHPRLLAYAKQHDFWISAH